MRISTPPAAATIDSIAPKLGLARWMLLMILPACLAFPFSACAGRWPAGRVGPAHALDAFLSALNHADIDALAPLFTPDATAFLPIDSSPSELVGREAILDALNPLFQDLRQRGAGPEYMHLSARNIHVQEVGDVAVVSFDAGAGPVTSRRTLVLRTRPGGWRIIHFHGSNIRQPSTDAGP